MLIDRLDLPRLRRDIDSASSECLSLKRVLRVPWTSPMADEQRRLARLARHVTELCVLRAGLRGRFHVTSPPRALRQAGIEWDRDAHRARTVERVAPDYAMRDDALCVEPAVHDGATAS